MIVMSVLSACATTPMTGDAGCVSYGEARLGMPGNPEILPDAWLKWIAEMDTRMTATCR